jgi:hypothetical protein
MALHLVIAKRAFFWLPPSSKIAIHDAPLSLTVLVYRAKLDS